MNEHIKEIRMASAIFDKSAGQMADSPRFPPLDGQRLQAFTGKVIAARVQPDGSYRIDVEVIAPAGSFVRWRACPSRMT